MPSPINKLGVHEWKLILSMLKNRHMERLYTIGNKELCARLADTPVDCEGYVPSAYKKVERLVCDVKKGRFALYNRVATVPSELRTLEINCSLRTFKKYNISDINLSELKFVINSNVSDNQFINFPSSLVKLHLKWGNQTMLDIQCIPKGVEELFLCGLEYGRDFEGLKADLYSESEKLELDLPNLKKLISTELFALSPSVEEYGYRGRWHCAMDVLHSNLKRLDFDHLLVHHPGLKEFKGTSIKFINQGLNAQCRGFSFEDGILSVIHCDRHIMQDLMLLDTSTMGEFYVKSYVKNCHASLFSHWINSKKIENFVFRSKLDLYTPHASIKKLVIRGYYLSRPNLEEVENVEELELRKPTCLRYPLVDCKKLRVLNLVNVTQPSQLEMIPRTLENLVCHIKKPDLKRFVKHLEAVGHDYSLWYKHKGEYVTHMKGGIIKSGKPAGIFSD
jgi:hypothetical protein